MTSSIPQSTKKVKDEVFQNLSLNSSNPSQELDKAHFSFNLPNQEPSNHTRASKKSYLGGKFPGSNMKNLSAAFGCRKIFYLGGKFPGNFCHF